jgi:hypothetical protein
MAEMDDEDLFKTAYERFAEEMDAIIGKGAVLKYLDIDLTPDVFVDADVCEMALVAAELLLRAGGEGVGEIPEEAERAARRWNFSYAPEDYLAAARTVVKLGQEGSELDLVMEAEGEEGYRAWKEYLGELAGALTARAGGV